jgi:hypothetical protein
VFFYGKSLLQLFFSPTEKSNQFDVVEPRKKLKTTFRAKKSVISPKEDLSIILNFLNNLNGIKPKVFKRKVLDSFFPRFY